MQPCTKHFIRIFALVLLFGTMIAAVRFLPDLDPDMIETAIDRVGPAAIVLLVALGIVVIPIPSGAIVNPGGFVAQIP